MLNLYFGLFAISSLVNLVNFYFAKLENPSYMDLFKGALYMLPFQFLIGLGFAFYYSKGIKMLPFGLLTTIYYPITIGMSIIISLLFFKDNTISSYQAFGLVFTMIGMIFFILGKVKGGI